MTNKTYTRQELEKHLENKYVSKLVSLKYPGYEVVHGIINQLGLETDGVVKISLGIGTQTKLYSISLESFQECVKILR